MINQSRSDTATKWQTNLKLDPKIRELLDKLCKREDRKLNCYVSRLIKREAIAKGLIDLE